MKKLIPLVLFLTLSISCVSVKLDQASKEFLSKTRHIISEKEKHGAWGPVISWPTVAAIAVVLPTGKVLSWGIKCQGSEFILWNPSSDTFVTYAQPADDLGIAAVSHLPDGSVLIAGGLKNCSDRGIDKGIKATYRFDPVDETLTKVADMNHARWLPSLIPLPDGRMFIMGGIDHKRRATTVPEVWDGSAWSEFNTSNNETELWPYQFVAPDGRVFRAGPEPLTDWLDVDTLSWTDVAPGDRNEAHHYGAYAQYGDGLILATGGCDTDYLDNIGDCMDNPVKVSAEVIDLNAPSPAWRTVASMASPRRQHHATILPDGTVLITGGTSLGTLYDNLAGPVYAAELWDPATETFSLLASISEHRAKHSSAVLLVDGRVLVAGGEYYDASGAWIKLRNAEIFSPPYLFRGPRPTISSAPSTVSYGESFFVSTPDSAEIANVNWVRLGAESYSWDSGQRFNRLSFSLESGGLTVTAPANSNLAAPGYYILFILDGLGVPSVGSVIQLI